MSPSLLAALLLLHALAHAGVGMWAAARVSPWLVTPLWLMAMVGFLAASLAIFGLERLRPHARHLTIAATLASALLLRLAGVALWSLLGLIVGLLFVALVRWWDRCTHPEIHTPTLTADDVPAPPAVPTLTDRVGAGLAYSLLGVTTLFIVARPWHQAWGSTAAERAAPVLGISVDPGAVTYRTDHAVTVQATAEQVWPWVAQLGQDRAGFYSYAWLERAAGDEITNADSLVPEWQGRAVGDLLRAAQPDYLGGRLGRDLGWRITHWDPPRAMTLEGWGTFSVAAIDDSTSRLRVQTRGKEKPSFAALPLAALSFYLLEPIHFVMERGMLLGIKTRAERAARTADQ